MSGVRTRPAVTPATRGVGRTLAVRPTETDTYLDPTFQKTGGVAFSPAAISINDPNRFRKSKAGLPNSDCQTDTSGRASSGRVHDTCAHVHERHSVRDNDLYDLCGHPRGRGPLPWRLPAAVR